MTKEKNVKRALNKEVSNKKLKFQQNYDQTESATAELKKLGRIILWIALITCVVYAVTKDFVMKSQMLKYSKNEVESQISYTDILASDILRKDGSYYVLVKGNDDPYMELYKTYISSYSGTEEHLPVYSVNLDDSLNQKYKAEQNDFSNENLKFKGTVLLKIVDRKVESYYQDNTSINEHLKSLVIK